MSSIIIPSIHPRSCKKVTVFLEPDLKNPDYRRSGLGSYIENRPNSRKIRERNAFRSLFYQNEQPWQNERALKGSINLKNVKLPSIEMPGNGVESYQLQHF